MIISPDEAGKFTEAENRWLEMVQENINSVLRVKYDDHDIEGVKVPKTKVDYGLDPEGCTERATDRLFILCDEAGWFVEDNPDHLLFTRNERRGVGALQE